MLVLGRKVGERIRIGESITVTIVQVKGDRVKLGFEAPHDVPVHREEVFERVEAERSEDGQPIQVPHSQHRHTDGCGEPSCCC